MKRILTSAITLISALTFNAQAEDYKNLDLFDHKVLTMILESDNYPLIKSEIYSEDLNDVMSSIHKISMDDKAKDIAPELSRSMVEIIKYNNPRLASYWDNKVSMKGMIINQSDTIFDMERIKYSSPEYATKSLGYNDLGIYEQENPIYTNEIPATSKHRMREGLPPVGPDGKDILVCRFLYLTEAPYYEMTYSDAERLIPKLNSNMTLSQACISSSVHMSTYWNHRVNDFNTNNRY